MDRQHNENRNIHPSADHCDEVRKVLDRLPSGVIWWSVALFAAITAGIAALLLFTDAASVVRTLIPSAS